MALLGATLIPAIICTLLTLWLLPNWWRLTVFFWYSIPGNSFVPLPHEPAVIYAGTIYAPVLVALVGGMATTVAATIDHTLITRTFQIEAVAQVKQSRIMRLTMRLFNRSPWWTVFLFAVTPVPFYPIRLIAPMASYPALGYVSAVVAGRIPRYFLLALGGGWVGQFF